MHNSGLAFNMILQKIRYTPGRQLPQYQRVAYVELYKCHDIYIFSALSVKIWQIISLRKFKIELPNQF